MNIRQFLRALHWGCAGLIVAGASAQSTFTSDEDHFTWGANVGWIEFRPERPAAGAGVRVHDTFLSGHAWSANAGWIHFGNGAPSSGIRYANSEGGEYGVNHDGAGNLSGLAWSANLGWINFGWAGAGGANSPRFSVSSGEFSGYAWSANAGWVNLASGFLRTDAMAIADSDGDGISDTWERARSGSLPILTASGDADGDGLSDKQEYIMDTDPMAANEPLRITRISQVPNQRAVELEWPGSSARVYTVEAKPELDQTSWLTLGEVPGVEGKRTAVNVEQGAPQAFFRVGAKLPLTP
ncbi:MAG TPA: hypothetical protein VJS65_11630 [Verrucomicrobiae bacterium]|nr:hypothetical protein [Verrucomicrobiae bacterium]